MIENEYIFTHVLTTKYYHYAIIVQIILTFVLAVLVFKGIERAFVLQLILACMMGFDILVRYLGDNTGQYWRSIWNKIDIAVLFVLFLLFVFETLVRSFVELQELQIFIIALRTVSQVYRVIRLVRQQKDSREVQNIEPIDLSFDHQNIMDKFH